MSEPVPEWMYNQSGVIPYRLDEDGRLEVALITSMKRRRWIIPKGVIDPGETAPDSAAREALEEAGLVGRVAGDPIGRYEYDKWGGTCTVSVYLMAVDRALETWDESEQRERRWMSVDEAATLVEEPHLQHLFRAVPALVRAG